MQMTNKAHLAASLAVFSAGLVFPSVAMADVVEIALAPSNVQNGIGSPRVVVGGYGKDKYDHVVTKTVDAWIIVSGHKPENSQAQLDSELRIEGGSTEIVNFPATSVHKISFPYIDFKPGPVANVRISPIKLCNDRLAALQGLTRTQFLKQGGSLQHPRAWDATAKIKFSMPSKGVVFKELQDRTWNAEPVAVGANIVCRPLDQPKPQTEPDKPPVFPVIPAKIEPTIKTATLRIEPAMIKRVGSDMCPTQLKLYGQVVTNRKFQGSAIIYGPGFLTPITSLKFDTPGARAVLGTYPLKWNAGASGSLSAGRSAPKSQTVSLTLNVANTDNKVIETARETVTVTCKRAPPPPAALR